VGLYMYPQLQQKTLEDKFIKYWHADMLRYEKKPIIQPGVNNMLPRYIRNKFSKTDRQSIFKENLILPTDSTNWLTEYTDINSLHYTQYFIMHLLAI
jgi:hypothetical protein